MVELTFQAVIYSVQKRTFSRCDTFPKPIETLYGFLIGAFGSECRFPKGYEKLNSEILEVSDFTSLEEVRKWVKDTTKKLKLPEQPIELSDLVVKAA